MTPAELDAALDRCEVAGNELAEVIDWLQELQAQLWNNRLAVLSETQERRTLHWKATLEPRL